MRIATFLLLVFSLACTPQSQQECETLDCQRQTRYDSIIIIHDEVMPMLGTIMSLQKELDSLSVSSTDSLQKDRIEQISFELNAAEHAMWVWMRQFRPNIDSAATQEDLDYLFDQKMKASDMADKIKSSILSAEEEVSRDHSH